VVYPSNFEDKIDFGTIRQLLQQYCISPMGEELADQLSFMADLPSITVALDQTEDMLRLLDEGLAFPVHSYFDLRQVFHHIRIDGTAIEQEHLFDLKLSLEVLKSILAFFRSEQAVAYPFLKALSDGIILDDSLVREANRIMDDKGQIADHASPDLKEIRLDIHRKQGAIERKIRQMLVAAKEAGWTESSAEITIRSGRMVIPVKAADKRKLKGFIHDESATGQTVFIEPAEIFETNNEIRELEYAEKREILRVLTAFTNKLRPLVPELVKAWKLLGMLDFCHAKALLAHALEARKPQVVNTPLIKWRQAVHPLLERNLQEHQKHAVPLDLYLDENERVLVISGPNAGGKSVCLKTAGLLQYMLQCGLHVPVDEASVFGIFDKLFIDIGDEQSLENDLSTYSSHLLHMRYFIEHTDSRSLFLIDEFGTGTEPQLGGAIAEVVLEELNKRKAYGIVTTHYANLKLLAERIPGMINGAMLYDNKRMQPLFVLRIGKPGSSFAFEIARKTGLPEELLQKAASITGHSQLNFEQQLQQLELEKVELAKKQAQVNLADAMLNEVIEKYEQLYKQLEDRKRSLMREAGKEAQALIDKANRSIELTIKEIKEAKAEKEKTKQLRKQLQAMKPKLAKEAVDKAQLSDIHEEIEDLPALKAGDKVSIEGMDVVGEILMIDDHDAVIAFNNVKLRTSPKKLNRLNKKKAKELSDPVQRTSKMFSEDLNEKAQQFKLTIDIRGKRAEEAVELTSRHIDEAILLSIKELSILHGKGNGILRRVIRDQLSRISEVASFDDAPIEAGGSGITRIKLR